MRPEILYDLVSQEFFPLELGENRIGIRINEYGSPKILAFRKEASLLTVRQQEIVNEVIAGKSDKEIARDLGISPYTVNHHANNILERLRDVGFLTIGGKLQVIGLLLQIGELEIRDSE